MVVFGFIENKANSVQLQLQLPTGTELGKISNKVIDFFSTEWSLNNINAFYGAVAMQTKLNYVLKI